MTPDPNKPRIAVLVSGRGSNLQALIDAVQDRRLEASIVVVVSNREGVEGLRRAERAGIETLCLNHRNWGSRDAYDDVLRTELQKRAVDLVCLAGFMRVLGPTMIDAFPNAIVNIHPSLLPAFPGVDAQRQALEHGVKITGVTVHLVTRELDGGPIILQRPVPVLDTDTVDSLSARILAEEHGIYPEAVKILLEGGWAVEGRRFLRPAGAAAASPPRPRADS
jgi:phosphoribosylglycinamide formyltransferase-1